MALIGFVMLYMLATIAIGLYAATRVSSTSDFALAGRSLPLPMVITATFATWFGSETILGLPGRFIESGIVGVIEEPFGSGMALILVGMFFAQKLYKLNILTIGDYYRERYGRGVEVLCTLFIVLSYLGWVGAQVAALGLVINLITEGYISVSGGMVIGTVVVLAYTMYGGMWSVAVTDFVQMIIIVLGLVAILFFASDLAGGFGKVIDYAHERDLFNALPEPTATGWLFWISSAITMMIGSIPQQDVFHAHDGHGLNVVVPQNLRQLLAVIHCIQLRTADQRHFAANEFLMKIRIGIRGTICCDEQPCPVKIG